MKYKIIKKCNSNLHVTAGVNNPDIVSITKHEWYEVKRKGRIFGFWHKVGHESGYEGERIQHTTRTLEEMKNYIKCWHEVNYGDKYKYEIIEKIKL